MKTKDIILTCNIPEGVTPEDLENFLAFKFMGHSVTDELLAKFEHEELDVDRILIK